MSTQSGLRHDQCVIRLRFTVPNGFTVCLSPVNSEQLADYSHWPADFDGPGLVLPIPSKQAAVLRSQAQTSFDFNIASIDLLILPHVNSTHAILSFSSQLDYLSSSQWAQNSTSDDEKAVRRVTIRQLWNAVPTDEEPFQFELNGIGIKQVILVANIQARDTNSGRHPEWYTLDDGTGRIKAYVNGRPMDHTYIYDGFEYARVVGVLEIKDETKSISLLNMAPVHDPHEVYFQILHAMVDTVTHNRGSPPTSRAHDQPVESLSQAFQHISLSNGNENEIEIGARHHYFISDNIDDGSVSLEDIVIHIRINHPDIEWVDAWDAIEYLLEENIIGFASDQDHYQLGERLNGSL